MPVLRHRVRAAGGIGPHALTGTRSLVIAPQWLGDAVMSQPLLTALAARGEQVTVAALPHIAPVFRFMPPVRDVVVLPFGHGRLDLAARWALAREWKGRFDVAYVLPNSFKSALVPFLAGIARRVGHRGESRVVVLTERLAEPDRRPPMVAHYGALAGAGFDATAKPRLVVADAAIDDALARFGLGRGRYWAFAPGAEYGPSKRWPTDRYAALARALHAKNGVPIALLGSSADRDACEAIAVDAGADACEILAGRTSLADAIAVVAGARGVVSNDSGLMHVAAATGVPQVAIFGSTDPLHTPPLNDAAEVIWLKRETGLACMPCFDRTCRYGHYRCLTSVAPERVESALARIDEGTSEGSRREQP